MIVEALHRAAEQVPTSKAAATGGAGAAVSIVAAAVEPSQIEAWMRIATLGVGLFTGLGSGGLVLLKYWDRYMTGRGPR